MQPQGHCSGRGFFCHLMGSGSCLVPWSLVDVVEELVDLGNAFEASFLHVIRSPHLEADCLVESSPANP